MVEFTSDIKFSNEYITYSYYPISEFKEYIFADTQQVLKELLESIKSQRCSKCTSQAKILFINKEDAARRRDISPNYGGYEYIVPSKEYSPKGHYFCNKHALDQVKGSLLAYSKPIIVDGGIWLPYKSDGFLTAAVI